MNKRAEKKAEKAIRKKDYDSAIKIYTEVLEENENDSTALSWIAHCYEWKGDLGQAVIFAERYLKHNSSDFDMLSLVNRYWSGKEDKEKIYQFACRLIENAPDRLPDMPNWIFWLLSPLILLARLIGVKDFKERTNQVLLSRNREIEKSLEWARKTKTLYETDT